MVNQRRVVAACSEEALASGVRIGMPSKEAETLLPRDRLVVEPHEPEADRRALRALAAWSHRFAPIVGVDDPPDHGASRRSNRDIANLPDGLIMDISGCAQVYGGEQAMADEVLRGFRSIGYRARVAIAPTFACAEAMARYTRGPTTIVPEGGAREALAPLPVRALRLGAGIVEGLSEVGVERIEQLYDLPRSALPSRFGRDLTDRLDKALGQAIDAITPIRPVDPPRARHVFDGPTPNWEAVEYVTRKLLSDLSAQLLELEAGATRLVFEMTRSDLPPAIVRATLSSPSRDTKHLWRLLSVRLEGTNLGHGAESITLTATAIERMDLTQATTSGAPSDGRSSDLAELLDTIASRLGPDRVRTAEGVASHLPERAAETFPISERPKTKQSPPPMTNTTDRPTKLFDPPIRAAVETAADGTPTSIAWRRESYAVTRAVGPERIGPEWWRDRDAADRDYHRLQTSSGAWVWAFRDVSTGDWFVQGAWM